MVAVWVLTLEAPKAVVDLFLQVVVAVDVVVVLVFPIVLLVVAGVAGAVVFPCRH